MAVSEKFQNIIRSLFCQPKKLLLNADRSFSDKGTPLPEKLNAAFLICLSGNGHPLYKNARNALLKDYSDDTVNSLAKFYLDRIKDIENEILFNEQTDHDFQDVLSDLEAYLLGSPSVHDGQFHNQVWQLFFPEGVGVFEDRRKKAEALQNSRIVEIKDLNRDPITDPGCEMLFTSNVLLGIPNKNTNIADLDYDDNLKQELKEASKEPQMYWYDHPIQIGVEPEANEILYGLMELDKSLDTERKRGNLKTGKVKCILSVSVTHAGLHKIAREYIRRELHQNCELKNLEVYVFTEDDTDQLIEEIFLQAATKYQNKTDARQLLQIFGVDGEYGRHYSFLKAIAAVWNVLFDQKIKATFKIDLDQVFPQKELIEQTGASAFEHFKTRLWGATGTSKKGGEIEMGMIAGALVNEKDIHKGLFTPDVVFPDSIPDKESGIFFSKMLMALSTEGELMTRYGSETGIDGKSKCIERIHVTGGTNGILVTALRKYRPFTPSFIARAEDQCYILSVLDSSRKSRLAYLHEDGLIMRHDKEAFAREALEAAKFGNIIGDYIRTLYFSEYSKAIGNNTGFIKDIVNPFTGCFISSIPITVCMMRFAIRGAGFYEMKDDERGHRFLTDNAKRLEKAISFVDGDSSKLKEQTEIEQNGWNLFYNILDDIEVLLHRKEFSALELSEKAKKIIENCRVEI